MNQRQDERVTEAQASRESPLPPLSPRSLSRLRKDVVRMGMRAFLCFVVIALSTSTGRAGGARVAVWQKDGVAAQGELLWVDNKGIVISVVEGVSAEELRRNPAMMVTYPIDQVEKLTTEGHSYYLAGLGCGIVGGLVVGAIIGTSQPSTPVPILGPVADVASTGTYMLIGVGAGALGGLLVGAALSSDESTYVLTSPAHLAELGLAARYHGERPDFLPTGGS